MCLTSHLKIRFQLLINFYSPIAITREAENLSGINNRQGISSSYFVVHFSSKHFVLFFFPTKKVSAQTSPYDCYEA